MKYNTVLKLMERNYKKEIQNGVTYFMNEYDKVVAINNSKRNLLVLYVYSSDRIVWNHHGIVAVAIAKDFKLIHNYEVRVADVIVMRGLCGACNVFERIANTHLELDSANYLSLADDDNDESYNFVEPIQIIDMGILTSSQFSSANLKGALISVTVRDANGTIGNAPYVVGKGLVKGRKIGAMGIMKNSKLISLDIGVEFDMSALALNSYSRDSHLFYDDNLVYGVISYKKLSRKAKKKKNKRKISTKDYTVYQYLRSENSWYWNEGFRTTGSEYTRYAILKTEHGNNYHRIANVTATVIK